MSSTEITITLPDQLAREAEANGLLTSESVEALLAAELRRRRQNAFFNAADRLTADESNRLTETEIEAEITAAREQRRSNASGR